MLRQSLVSSGARRALLVNLKRSLYRSDVTSNGFPAGFATRYSFIALLVGSAAVLSYTYAKVRPVSNDAPAEVEIQKDVNVQEKPSAVATLFATDSEHLRSIAWGSNKEGLICPSNPQVDSFREPYDVPWLKNVGLRDLVLHEKYGACVDGRGDVYLWNKEVHGPKLWLSGKDIVGVQASPSTIFALSSSGKIYSILVRSEKKLHGIKAEPVASSVWSWLGRGSIDDRNKDCIELKPDQKLHWGEKFVSISAGRDHLLVLTSDGRAFGYPITKDANSHGQLGFRKFTLPRSEATHADARVPVMLVPKALTEPIQTVRLKPPARRLPMQGLISEEQKPMEGVTSEDEMQKEILLELDKAGDQFCDRLFEIPSLRGLKIAQAVAGARSSYVRTESDGKVLAWGANEYGQLGLGSTLIIDTVTVPTEVILVKSGPPGAQTYCKNIVTGGDLTFFIVERRDGSFIPTTDILSCGMGRWGGLGTGLYSTARSDPSRVRGVSGLLEFSEQTQNLQPIVPYALSVSPTGHVLLTLDTLSRAGPGVEKRIGKDLFVWGANCEYQLGNRRRTSLAAPAALELQKGAPKTATATSIIAEGAGIDRFMLQQRAHAINDLQGRPCKTNVNLEQCPVAGWNSSIVYWKICDK